MKQIAIWSVSLCLICIFSMNTNAYAGTRAIFEGMVPRISKEELNARLGDPSVLIMDVRRAAHFDASPSKIKGAVRVSPNDVANWSRLFPKRLTFILY